MFGVGELGFWIGEIMESWGAFLYPFSLSWLNPSGWVGIYIGGGGGGGDDEIVACEEVYTVWR